MLTMDRHMNDYVKGKVLVLSVRYKIIYVRSLRRHYT